MLLLEDDPDFDPEDLESEFFQTVSTEAVARKWVDQVISESNPAEILRYVEIFLGLRPVQRRVSTRRKGGGVNDTCDDTHDARIYRLLALADSIHDGCSRDFGQTPESIMRYMRMENRDLPKGLRLPSLTEEDEFIQFLQRRKTLRFKQDDVANPLHGADLAHFDLQPSKVGTAGPRSDVLSATYKRAAETVQRSGLSPTRRILCVPVYGILDRTSAKLRRIQLVQILDLAARMRSLFGQQCVFQPDSQHPILKFLTATKHIDTAFYNKFITDKDFTVSKFEDEIFRAINAQGDGAKTRWNTVLCDANYYDGTSIADPLDIDKTPTGWVFRHGIEGISHHNVRLEGITNQDQVKFSEFLNNKLVSVELPRSRTQTVISTSALFSQLPGALPTRDPGNAQARGIDLNSESSQKLNLKRAGDWSQVEACKRSGRIFLTEDRLAALYAFYRGVPFLLLKIHQFYELGDNMCQYSCCLGKGA